MVECPVARGTDACVRCLYPASVPGIFFGEGGLCNYCRLHDQLDEEYPTGFEGYGHLVSLAERISADGRGKKFDVVVGVSGGCDSSYMLWYTKNMLGLRPLAAHFDNTWNSVIAVQNIQHVCSRLDVELFMHVMDPREMDDLLLSFMKAGVNDIDTPTDIGLASTLYMAAAKHGVKWIFEGHSFRTEGIAPLGWIYMDGKYVESVHRQFGTLPMRTFPNLTMRRFLKWSAWNGIKRIRPLYYMDYVKEDAKKHLTEKLGWNWYGGHHLENRFTAFYWNYFVPRRWGYDGRLLGTSALVRSGQMKRADGEAYLATPHGSADVDLVKKRFGLSEVEFDALMNLPKKSWRDYSTYKKSFERMRWFWWVMMKLERVPRSFFSKFCYPCNAMK